MGRRKKSSTFWDALGILFLFDLFTPKKRSRKKNESSLGDILILFFGLFWLMGIGLYACYKLIEWSIKGIIYMVAGIAKFIEYLSNKSVKSNSKTINSNLQRINYSNNNTTSTTSNLLPKTLNYNNINYKEPIKYEEQKLMLPKYKVSTPYDALFTDVIMARGIDYFNSKKVNNYKLEEQICTADINGTEDYKTKIEFYKNGKLKKAECTCPYFEKDNVYCKHIYALLLNYCDKENITGFINEKFYEEKSKTVPNYKTNDAYNKMITICEAMQEIINNTQEFYDELEDTSEIEDIYSEIMEYEEKINKYHNSKITDVNQLLINSAQNELDEMRSLYDDLEVEIDELEDNEYEDSSNDELVGSAIATGLVAHQINKRNKEIEEQNEYDEEHEKLKSDWGLLDWEADLVQKGDYEPWNFSEPGEGDELDEDDYYYDDSD